MLAGENIEVEVADDPQVAITLFETADADNRRGFHA
jgi:hypothetical protein